MSNFKVGDAVVAVREFPGQLTRGKEYTILSISYEGWHRVRTDNGTVDGFTANAFRQATDDPLPPVPDSVAYLNTKRDPGNDQRLVLERDSDTDEGLLYIGIVPRKGSTRAEREIGINMSPDAALQLAHDLRRMAMSVKREQK
ncbi:hypothetical protein NER40_00010 [Klebsiella phage vB_KpnP_NER40]|nr:hypothetical protein NER40_00010 [Klebsiella phage vB_KpnP_NER40]